MENIEDILAFLKSDPIKNLSMVGFIENNKITRINKFNDSVFAIGRSDHDWIYISSASKEDVESITDELAGSGEYFASLEDWMLPLVTKNKNIDWLLTTMRFYLPADVQLKTDSFRVAKLSANDAEIILENSNYKDFLSIEYLQERISKSFSAGIYEGDHLAGWALTHDDGALGSLHVMEEHRGKGYGEALITYLIVQCRAAGKIPFAQIEEKNLPAVKLISKLGFTADRRVTWIKLK